MTNAANPAPTLRQGAPAVSRPMSAREWAMLVALSLLWGGSFFFNGVAVRELPPLTIAFLRVALAAAALLAVCAMAGVRVRPDRHLVGAFFAMGFLNNLVPFGLILWGQTQIASGLASILNATTPLFTVVAAHFLTADEKMTGGKLGGVAIGIAGVVVLIGPAALSGFSGHVLAQLACLGAAISYAFASIFGKRFRALGVPPLATAAGQLSASSLLLAPLALAVDRPFALALPGAGAIAAIAGLALLSSALAYVLFFRILATAGATNLVLVTLLIPVSAIWLGYAFLGETIGARDIAGMALIAAGLAAIDGRAAAALKARFSG
jgi:drug/metabolite transporter (DMT)-like permease